MCTAHNGCFAGPCGGIMYEGRSCLRTPVLLARHRLFDGWPKLSPQSAATSAQRSAKFSAATSLNKSNIGRTCVIAAQSDLNRAANYWLMAVLRFPHKGDGFSSSLPSRFVPWFSLSQAGDVCLRRKSSLVPGKNSRTRLLVTWPVFLMKCRALSTARLSGLTIFGIDLRVSEAV